MLGFATSHCFKQ
ncbi:hypothetical protein D047_2293A, partial [Vibrio parahaemolyticus VPTS-2010_2]